MGDRNNLGYTEGKNMKNYKAVTPLILIAVLVIGIYTLVGNVLALNAQYQELLSSARDDASKGMIQAAADNYAKALNIHQDVDLGHEIIEFYRNNYDEHSFLKYMQKYTKLFPQDDCGYNEVANATFSNKEYQKFYDNYSSAMKAGINMQTINDLRSQLKWVVDVPKRLSGSLINNAGFNSDGRAYIADASTSGNKGMMTLIGRNGDEVGTYNKVGPFFDGKAPVYGIIDGIKDKVDNKAFFIDSEGAAIMTSNDIYEEFGPISSGIFPAKNSDNKWIYLDTNFSQVSGTDSYDVATAFYNGIAAVGYYSVDLPSNNDADVADAVASDFVKLINSEHEGISWQIIKTDGSKLVDKEFADVKINNNGMISGSKAFFARENGDLKWKMFNSSDGSQIGQDEYDDVYAFNSNDQVSGETYAAVKKDDKWGFVRSNGEMKIDYKFGNAFSFLNGTAPVTDTDKSLWGYIDDSGDYVILPNYLFATSFNQMGRAIVQISPDRWSMISLVESLYGVK